MKKCRFCGYPLKEFKMGDEEYYCESCRLQPIPIEYIKSVGVCMSRELRIKILLLLFKSEELRFTDILNECGVNSAKLTFHITRLKEMDIISNGSGEYSLTVAGRFVAEFINQIWFDYYEQGDDENE